jgi:signal transduction histidine kinase
MRALADTLDHKLISAQQVLNGAARLVESAQLGDAGQARQFLLSRTFLLRSFEAGICLHDADGLQVACSQADEMNAAKGTTPPEAMQLALRSGQAQLSVAVGRQGNVEVLMVAPVSAGDGRVAGALTGRLPLLSPEYAGKLAVMKLGRTGYLYLVDGRRQLLMHPDASRLLKTATRPGQNLGLDRALMEGYQGSLENVNSQSLRSLSTFVRLPTLGWVLAGNYPISEVKESSQRAPLLGLALLAAAALLLTALVVVILRRLFLPVRSLALHLRALGQGQARPFQAASHGEVAQIASAYNQMLADLDLSERQRQGDAARVLELNAHLEQRVRERTAELEDANQELEASLRQITQMQDALVRNGKVVALNRMVAGLAHELNTPLGNALTLASTLSGRHATFVQRLESATLRRSELFAFLESSGDAAQLVEKSLLRAITLVGNMRELADDSQAMSRSQFDLRERIEAWAATQQQRMHRTGIELCLKLNASCMLDSYTVPLDRVLAHLLDNAVTHAFALRQQGWPPPAVALYLHAGPEGTALLVFEDNGCGMAAAQLSRVFEPFYAGALGQQGAGLGLSIVHHLVSGVLGGSIVVESAPAQGTRFVIRLPQHAPSQML